MISEPAKHGGRVSTTLILPTPTWLMLRHLAEVRAVEQGGRPSANRVMLDLIEAEAQRRREGQG